MIVYDNGEVYVVWNGSATFNVFLNDANVECFTVYNIIDTAHAITVAENWMRQEWPFR